MAGDTGGFLGWVHDHYSGSWASAAVKMTLGANIDGYISGGTAVGAVPGSSIDKDVDRMLGTGEDWASQTALEGWGVPRLLAGPISAALSGPLKKFAQPIKEFIIKIITVLQNIFSGLMEKFFGSPGTEADTIPLEAANAKILDIHATEQVKKFQEYLLAQKDAQGKPIYTGPADGVLNPDAIKAGQMLMSKIDLPWFYGGGKLYTGPIDGTLNHQTIVAMERVSDHSPEILSPTLVSALKIVTPTPAPTPGQPILTGALAAAGAVVVAPALPAGQASGPVATDTVVSASETIKTIQIALNHHKTFLGKLTHLGSPLVREDGVMDAETLKWLKVKMRDEGTYKGTIGVGATETFDQPLMDAIIAYSKSHPDEYSASELNDLKQFVGLQFNNVGLITALGYEGRALKNMVLSAPTLGIYSGDEVQGAINAQISGKPVEVEQAEQAAITARIRSEDNAYDQGASAARDSLWALGGTAALAKGAAEFTPMATALAEGAASLRSAAGAANASRWVATSPGVLTLTRETAAATETTATAAPGVMSKIANFFRATPSRTLKYAGAGTAAYNMVGVGIDTSAPLQGNLVVDARNVPQTIASQSSSNPQSRVITGGIDVGQPTMPPVAKPGENRVVFSNWDAPTH